MAGPSDVSRRSEIRRHGYAEQAYAVFADQMKKSATTSLYFRYRHSESRKFSWIIWKRPGIVFFRRKDQYGQNTPGGAEENSVSSAADSLAGKCPRKIRAHFSSDASLYPQLYRRTDEISGGNRREYALPVQSHLSENQDEVAWVKELCPKRSFTATLIRGSASSAARRKQSWLTVFIPVRRRRN